MKKHLFLIACLFVGLFGSNVFSKKKIPELPKPIIFNGIIYKADQNDEDIGINYNKMGIIKAIDQKSKKELWEKQLYKIRLTDRMEEDVQMVFITDIQVDSVHNILIIKNEKGDVYNINLANREAYEIIEYKIKN
jgi:hypothetical protein